MGEDRSQRTLEMDALSTLLRTIVRRLRQDDRGASLVEYALLVALIAVVCVGAVAFFGKGSGNSVDHSKTCMEAAYAGQPPPAGCE
jgi:pilus assembly protein Flp/PilA